MVSLMGKPVWSAPKATRGFLEGSGMCASGGDFNGVCRQPQCAQNRPVVQFSVSQPNEDLATGFRQIGRTDIWNFLLRLRETSIGVYRKLPEKLDPIKIEHGKAAQLILTFDNSTKAP